jgi:hypothetical protein
MGDYPIAGVCLSRASRSSPGTVTTSTGSRGISGLKDSSCLDLHEPLLIG